MLKTPALNRRRLLLGLAAASAGAAATAATASAFVAPVAPVAPENPALLALVDQLDAAVQEMRDAEAHYWRVVEEWEPRWPAAPEAIVSEYATFEQERGLRGFSILPDGSIYQIPSGAAFREPHQKPRYLYEPRHFSGRIRSIDRAMKRHRPKHPLTVAQLMDYEAERAQLVDRLTAANDYFDRCEEIKALSGHDAAHARRNAAGETLSAIVAKVMAEKPATMAGVLVQAQALEAFALAPMFQFHPEGWKWPRRFAASLLRIAREAPAEQA